MQAEHRMQRWGACSYLSGTPAAQLQVTAHAVLQHKRSSPRLPLLL